VKSPRHAPSVEEAWDIFCRVVDAEKQLPVEERIKVALAEILAPKHELLRRRAEVIAQPIAERHDVTVAAIFGLSRARYITAARDELCGELLGRAWSPADVARALGFRSENAPAQAAERYGARVAAGVPRVAREVSRG
jgi:hypothetical protein